MELTSRLDRSRYRWLAPDIENADPAALLVEVTTPPAAATAIAQECGELAGHRFLQCRLTISPGNGVGPMTLLNDLPHRFTPVGDLVIELGNLAADQSRNLVLLFDPKRAIKPGRRKVGTLRISYLVADDLSDGSTSQTVWAQIASLADTPGRIDRDVASEVLFQGVQRHKAVASEALRRGNFKRAEQIYRLIVSDLSERWGEIPLDRRSDFKAEIDMATRYVEQLNHDAFGS